MMKTGALKFEFKVSTKTAKYHVFSVDEYAFKVMPGNEWIVSILKKQTGKIVEVKLTKQNVLLCVYPKEAFFKRQKPRSFSPLSW